MYLALGSMDSHFGAGDTENFLVISSHMWPSDMRCQSDQPVRVFLANEDDHVRRVICQELMRDSRTLLVGQAASYQETLKNIYFQDFDVIIIDFLLEEGKGSGAAELSPADTCPMY